MNKTQGNNTAQQGAIHMPGNDAIIALVSKVIEGQQDQSKKFDDINKSISDMAVANGKLEVSLSSFLGLAETIQLGNVEKITEISGRVFKLEAWRDQALSEAGKQAVRNDIANGFFSKWMPAILIFIMTTTLTVMGYFITSEVRNIRAQAVYPMPAPAAGPVSSPTFNINPPNSR